MKRKVLICILSLFATLTTAETSQSYAYAETCKASWYGKDFHMKNPMANGDLFNMYDSNLAAHKKLPLGTTIRITNLTNGLSIIAEVTDRGPFKPGRCVDVSMRGAEKLGFKQAGITQVKVEVL